MSSQENAEMLRLRSENARMRDLLSRRPALNGGLIEAYIAWTRLVYTSDAIAAQMRERAAGTVPMH